MADDGTHCIRNPGPAANGHHDAQVGEETGNLVHIFGVTQVHGEGCDQIHVGVDKDRYIEFLCLGIQRITTLVIGWHADPDGRNIQGGQT